MRLDAPDRGGVILAVDCVLESRVDDSKDIRVSHVMAHDNGNSWVRAGDDGVDGAKRGRLKIKHCDSEVNGEIFRWRTNPLF